MSSEEMFEVAIIWSYREEICDGNYRFDIPVYQTDYTLLNKKQIQDLKSALDLHSSKYHHEYDYPMFGEWDRDDICGKINHLEPNLIIKNNFKQLEIPEILRRFEKIIQDKKDQELKQQEKLKKIEERKIQARLKRLEKKGVTNA